MIFQFSDGEFSDPIATSLKMWKKINSFIVIIAFSVTLEKLNRNPPPSKVFPNNPSCKKYSAFISETLLQRIEVGAVLVWGQVGKVEPPYIVLPFTVEPSKPRLCQDARFLNNWMRD